MSFLDFEGDFKVFGEVVGCEPSDVLEDFFLVDAERSWCDVDAVDCCHEGLVKKVEEIFAPLEFLQDCRGCSDFHEG